MEKRLTEVLPDCENLFGQFFDPWQTEETRTRLQEAAIQKLDTLKGLGRDLKKWETEFASTPYKHQIDFEKSCVEIRERIQMRMI